jgi:hypothetical protein
MEWSDYAEGDRYRIGEKFNINVGLSGTLVSY